MDDKINKPVLLSELQAVLHTLSKKLPPSPHEP
jgi:hypothetical protein